LFTFTVKINSALISVAEYTLYGCDRVPWLTLDFVTLTFGQAQLEVVDEKTS
jgi:hypothetical protein